jgi:hypothetical protein
MTAPHFAWRITKSLVVQQKSNRVGSAMKAYDLDQTDLYSR